MHRFRCKKTGHGLHHDEYRAHEEHGRTDDCAEHGVTLVPERLFGRAAATGYPFHCQGEEKRYGISEVVNGIRENGDTVGEKSADELHDGEDEVEKESHPEGAYVTFLHLVGMMVMMIMAHGCSSTLRIIGTDRIPDSSRSGPCTLKPRCS
jgi:hypothetical protein